jgi:hypothetical protein
MATSVNASADLVHLWPGGSMRTNSPRVVYALPALVTLAAHAPAALVTGDPAPGTAPGVVFSTFDRPSLGSQGQVAVLATLSGPNVDATNNDALYAGVASAPVLVTREGSPVPGLGASVLSAGTTAPTMNAPGSIAFTGSLKGPLVNQSNNAAIFAGPPGATTVVIRKGDPGPDTAPGVTILSWGVTRPTPLYNTQGHVAFSALLTSSAAPDLRAIYAGPPTAPKLVALSTFGTPGGAGPYNAFTDPVLNNHDGVAFWSLLTAPPDQDQAIVASDPNNTATLVLVAQKGAHAPGTAPLVRFGDLNRFPSINNNGQVAFSAALVGDVTPTHNAGVWAGSPGVISVVARAGDAVPGSPAGTTYGNAFSGPNINATGRVTFAATIANAPPESDLALFSGAGLVSLVAREGDRAPGTPADVVFGQFLDVPGVNADGQLAFRALVAGPGVTGANDLALFATTPGGDLLLVAREGDVLDLGLGQPVQLKDIALYTGSGGQDGLPRSLNDEGQLAFSATLSSLTAPGALAPQALPPTLNAVLVVTVPDPSRLATFVVLAPVLQRRRGRFRRCGWGRYTSSTRRTWKR